MPESYFEAPVPVTNEDALRDFRTVNLYSSTGKILYCQGRINKETATNGQVVQWAEAQDPLDEYLLTSTRSIEDMIKLPGVILDRATTARKGAMILLGMKEFNRSNSRELRIGVDSANAFLAGELLLDAWAGFQMIRDHSSEMRRIIDFPLSLYPLTPEVKDKIKFAQQNYRILLNSPSVVDIEEKESDCLKLGLGIMGEVTGGIAGPTDMDRILGLKALWLSASEVGQQSWQNREGKIKMLRHMVDGLETTFLGEQGLLSNPTISRQFKKGLLFELAWVLDAQILSDIKYNSDVQISPSSSFDDMPIVGRPKLRRGIDAKIAFISKDISFPIQLKSGTNQKDKKYHPLIKVVNEQNFQDINPGRLHKKLEAYRRLLDSNYAEGEIPKAMEYILPSVKAILGGIKTDDDFSSYYKSQYGYLPWGLENGGITLEGLLSYDSGKDS